MEIAKYILACVAVLGCGGFVADAVVPFTARQHIRNPAWPPHAKFHNAQTMVFGILNGLIALGILFGSETLTLPLLFLAAVVASAYWVTMVVAAWFPGTKWCDPEFAGDIYNPIGLHPQQLLSYVLCGLVGIAIIVGIAGG